MSKVLKHTKQKQVAPKQTSTKRPVSRQTTPRSSTSLNTTNTTTSTKKLDPETKKLVDELNILSAGITAHEKILTERKAKLQNSFKEVKGTKKPLEKAKKSLISLQELMVDFERVMGGRNLVAEDCCEGYKRLQVLVERNLAYIDTLETQRVENKYGLGKNYTGKYLTISKKNSERGVKCENALQELKNTINNLKDGNMSIEDATKIRDEYSDLLATSKAGLENLTKELTQLISNPNNSQKQNISDRRLNKKYQEITREFYETATELSKTVEKIQNEFDKIKRTAPKDDSMISIIESWIKTFNISRLCKYIKDYGPTIVNFSSPYLMKYGKQLMEYL